VAPAIQHTKTQDQHNNRNRVLSRSLHHYRPKYSSIQWAHILPTYIINSRSQQILMFYS